MGWIDFNNDGWKDLFTANSHVNDIVEKVEAYRYREPNSVFVNRGDGTFLDDSSTLDSARAHRGAAFADFDGDGRMDVVVSALNDPAELWRNVTPGAGHWLRVVPRGTVSNRDGIGAVVTVAGQTSTMNTAVSYSSSSHYGVHFGLGAADKPVEVVIRWPSGAVRRMVDVKADQVLEAVEPGSKRQ